MSAFGARLRRLRVEDDLTQGDIAKAVGVSKPTVWAWEQGRANPTTDHLNKLYALYGYKRFLPDPLIDVSVSPATFNEVLGAIATIDAEVIETLSIVEGSHCFEVGPYRFIIQGNRTP